MHGERLGQRVALSGLPELDLMAAGTSSTPLLEVVDGAEIGRNGSCSAHYMAIMWSPHAGLVLVKG